MEGLPPPSPENFTFKILCSNLRKGNYKCKGIPPIVMTHVSMHTNGALGTSAYENSSVVSQEEFKPTSSSLDTMHQTRILLMEHALHLEQSCALQGKKAYNASNDILIRSSMGSLCEESSSSGSLALKYEGKTLWERDTSASRRWWHSSHLIKYFFLPCQRKSSKFKQTTVQWCGT